MRLRIYAALPLVAALLAIAPAVSVDHSASKSSDGPVSDSADAARRSGGKASGGFKR